MAQQRTISIGPLIGLLGAVLLLVSLFLEWYESTGNEPAFTAFTVFEVLDLVLALIAIAAIVALVEALGVRPLGGARSLARLALPLGAVALVVVVSQLLNDPPAIAGSGRGPEVGLWLALAGSLLIVAGGLLSMARISLALDIEQRATAAERRHEADPGERRREREPPPSSSEAPTSAVPPVDPESPAAGGRPERPI